MLLKPLGMEIKNDEEVEPPPRTAAFKKKIALEALREDKTLNQLASEHGIHPLQVGKWKKELIEGAESLFESKKDRKQDNVSDRATLST